MAYLLAINLSLQFMFDNNIPNTDFYIPYIRPEIIINENDQFPVNLKQLSDINSKVGLYSNGSNMTEIDYIPGKVLDIEPESPGFFKNLKW
jgi:hypothetical protein